MDRASPPKTFAETASGSPWAGFDRVYCISLAERKDRRERAAAEFERVGLGGRVEFVIVQRHPSDSEQGIFESHMACLRTGLAAGAKVIAVFEDDVLLEKFSPRKLGEAVGFLKSGVGWDIFFFGCFVKASRKTVCASVVRVRYQSTTHAYAVNRAFAQRLVNTAWSGVAYDDMIRGVGDGRYYAAYPAFAFQSDAASDNDKTAGLDRVRRLMGGLRRLQKWNEFSRRHWFGLIVGHVAAVGVIVVIVLRVKGVW